MNKNYKKAIINEMFDQKILNSEDDRAEAKEMLDGMWDCGDLTGDFDEDIEAAVEAWKTGEEDEEVAPKSIIEGIEEEVEEIISQLHVGSNLIPGLGIAFAHSEEDLKDLQSYLRGWLAAHFTLKRIFEDWA